MNFNASENVQMNQDYNPSYKKSKKIIIIVIIFLLILLLVTYAGYSYYIKNGQKEALRSEFFDNIKNNDLSFFMNNEIYTGMAQKVEKDDYESSSNIKLSTTMENNMFSKLDLSKFEFNYDFSRNNNDNRNFHRITTKYAGNDLLTLDFIGNDKQFAVKSDEIVNKYVGIDKSNVQKISDELMETQTDLSTIKQLKNFVLDREYIEFNNIAKISSWNKYASLVKDNTSADNFSKKENVVVTMDSEQINTTEYTVELTNEQVSNILNGISETIENDNELLSELVVSQVQDFENDEGNILEYTDNENVTEISGEENNFNTYLNWGEENVEDPDSNITNMVLNQVESNTIQNNNTTSNETVNQNTTNSNQIQTEQINQEEQNETTPTSEQITTQQEVQTSETSQTIQQVENTSNETNNQVIEEEDNVRTQGFIEVNDEENSDEEEEEIPFIIGENFEETLKNIIKSTEKINWTSYLYTAAKANCTQEELLEQLQKILTDRIKQNNSLIIKMYVSDGKNIKMNFEIPENSESFDIEIVSKGEQEKYLNVTSLLGKHNDASGYKVSLYKKNADADVKTKIAVNRIHKNKINQKFNVDLETKGTTNSKKYTTSANVVYSDSDGEFKMEIANSLNFDVAPEIEELNNDNCLFIDAISNEELLLTRDAIKQKTMDVLKDKNRNLNIIDINNENSVVQQTEQKEAVQEDTEAKEDAKQILIQTISNKMGEYQNAGTQLKIDDLDGLEIPGYQVDVSISSNLAIITVNGYKFKLDSDFNLSDS